jgi:nicotinamidase/pyrazinamidase
VFLGGLALDFCVRYSAEDARRLGFDVIVIEDSCRAIDVAGSRMATYAAFEKTGIRRVNSVELSRE